MFEFKEATVVKAINPIKNNPNYGLILIKVKINKEI